MIDSLAKLIIATLTLAMFACAGGYLLAVKGATEATTQMILTALIAWCGSVIGYYIGSSAGSSAKDTTITTMAANTPPVPPKVP